MTEPKIELCQIRQVSSIDDGFLGLGFTRIFRLYYAAYVGENIITKSDTWEVKSSNFEGSASSQEKATEYSNQQREVAYQQVFQKLVADGWEPVGTNEEGRFMSFQRKSTTSKDQKDIVTELERLSHLKVQGLITVEEFEKAKRKLLG